jgi:hypothetical protein
MIRDTMATRRNKEQQKRRKTDNGKTVNVNHVMIDGAQGAKQKVKRLPSMFKNEVFLLVVKNSSI